MLDFYCPEAKLCVEVDGEQHALSADRDRRRDERLAAIGVLTVRIPSLDLFAHESTKFSFWLNHIAQLCEERTGRSVWTNGLDLS